MTELVKQESRIAPWGDRNDVREIARRVQLMAPGAKKLSENEALALAQGAVAHELDPFNGEIWFIPGSGLMAGIKGLRKAARKQLREGENFWVEFEAILDMDKRALYQIPEGALAFEAQLRDTQTLMTYSNAWKDLADSGIPVDVIPSVVGKQPFTLGIGIFEKDERTKMKPVQAAMKRAEADAIKRRFDLPFATPANTDEETIEADWAEVGNLEEDKPEPGFSQNSTSPSIQTSDDPVKKQERPVAPEALKTALLIRAGELDSGTMKETIPGLVVGVLNEIFAGPNSDHDRHALCQDIFGEPSTKDLENKAILALQRWLDPLKNEATGEWLPNAHSKVEAIAYVDMLIEENRYEQPQPELQSSG